MPYDWETLTLSIVRERTTTRTFTTSPTGSESLFGLVTRPSSSRVLIPAYAEKLSSGGITSSLTSCGLATLRQLVSKNSARLLKLDFDPKHSPRTSVQDCRNRRSCRSIIEYLTTLEAAARACGQGPAAGDVNKFGLIVQAWMHLDLPLRETVDEPAPETTLDHICFGASGDHAPRHALAQWLWRIQMRNYFAQTGTSFTLFF